ncbi:hypothetical protein HBH98_244010 [Parastagonospora nodorum]|nr:hypothetical protein HBH53_230550 [Parastagonospora nodorum]KAH3956357.1 hypothetical protein HBH51_243890 [Parastagonospora nodorum]KAH4215535.1 hypothetical protein HBI06_247940 [Parastagonospora nodorum]KAH4224216.1 hypothetical protein HBI05_242090 [Parastagonospora nodorum]KAH4334264.1 hypothetical protein HBH98_244010 [Parastagonospora nodorum]
MPPRESKEKRSRRTEKARQARHAHIESGDEDGDPRSLTSSRRSARLCDSQQRQSDEQPPIQRPPAQQAPQNPPGAVNDPAEPPFATKKARNGHRSSVNIAPCVRCCKRLLKGDYGTLCHFWAGSDSDSCWECWTPICVRLPTAEDEAEGRRVREEAVRGFKQPESVNRDAKFKIRLADIEVDDQIRRIEARNNRRGGQTSVPPSSIAGGNPIPHPFSRVPQVPAPPGLDFNSSPFGDPNPFLNPVQPARSAPLPAWPGQVLNVHAAQQPAVASAFSYDPMLGPQPSIGSFANPTWGAAPPIPDQTGRRGSGDRASSRRERPRSSAGRYSSRVTRESGSSRLGRCLSNNGMSDCDAPRHPSSRDSGSRCLHETHEERHQRRRDRKEYQEMLRRHAPQLHPQANSALMDSIAELLERAREQARAEAYDEMDESEPFSESEGYEVGHSHDEGWTRW